VSHHLGRIALSLAILLTSCATVHPWQREQLARRCMALDDDEGGGIAGQVRSVRVGDVRAGSAGGGGCGCR